MSALVMSGSLSLLVIGFRKTYSHKLVYFYYCHYQPAHIFDIENVRWLIMADIFRGLHFPGAGDRVPTNN